MHSRITEDLKKMEFSIKKDPELRQSISEKSGQELDPISPKPIQDQATKLGFDALGLICETSKIIEENNYDLIKTRRRIEEHLRKYADARTIVGLAIFLGVPIK